MSNVIIISQQVRPFEKPAKYFSVSYANGDDVESYTTCDLDAVLDHVSKYFEGNDNE